MVIKKMNHKQGRDKWLTWLTSSSGTAVGGTAREPIAHPDAPPLAPLRTTRPRPRTGARADVLNDMADGAEPQRLKNKSHDILAN